MGDPSLVVFYSFLLVFYSCVRIVVLFCVFMTVHSCGLRIEWHSATSEHWATRTWATFHVVLAPFRRKNLATLRLSLSTYGASLADWLADFKGDSVHFCNWRARTCSSGRQTDAWGSKIVNEPLCIRVHCNKQLTHPMTPAGWNAGLLLARWLCRTRLKPKFRLARHVSTRHDSTPSTCRAHAFWLCRSCRTARLRTFDTTSATCAIRKFVV